MKRLAMVAALLALAAFSFAQDRFLVVTPANTAEAVKAALDATAALPGGVGFSASGSVAVLDDTGAAALEFHGSHLTTIWPTNGAAPFAWYVTPEDDAGTFTASFGAAVSTALAESAQRLLIDGDLHRSGSAQAPGVRPSVLRVSLQRSDPVIDASGRTVEVPSPAKARVARQPPTSGDVVVSRPRSALGARSLSDSLIVWDNSADVYRRISVRTFLDGIYTEPDEARRYVATKVAATRPMFTERDFLDGANAAGLTSGIAMPPVPMGAERVWVGVALESGTDFPYFALQSTNVGFNARTQVFPADRDDLLEIDGSDYDVYVELRDRSAPFAGTGFYAFFDRDSTIP